LVLIIIFLVLLALSHLVGELFFVLLLLARFNALENIGDVIIPLHAGVGHAEAHLGVFFLVVISSLFGNLHRAVEVLSASIIVALLCQKLAQLHEGASFSLAVLKLGAQLEIPFNKHL
jgi:hypothetical protein